MNKKTFENFACDIRDKFISEIEAKCDCAKNQQEKSNIDMHDISARWFIRYISICYMKAKGFMPQNQENLKSILPFIFDGIGELEMLLKPDDFFSEEGYELALSNINKAEWQNIEIVGWLYQNFISEKKNEVFGDLDKNKKIRGKDIAPATQLFTPDWIVKYLVQNSLGKVCLELTKKDELSNSWKFYLNSAEQEKSVENYIASLKTDSEKLEDIKILDPAVGSGHILVYAFDLLYDVYKKMGYKIDDIPSIIIENNLYGIDIDEKVVMIAYFALMMKGREKCSSFLESGIEPNICVIESSNEENPYHENDGIYGSLINPLNANSELNFAYANKAERLLSIKYDVVCTNPPYMGKNNLNLKLRQYIEKNYKEGKCELYAAFILRCLELTKINGYAALVTIHTWLFITTFKDLREKLLKNICIDTMVHTGAGTFEELNAFNVLAVAFCFRNCKIEDFKSKFIRLTDYKDTKNKIENYSKEKNRYIASQSAFALIPGNPIVYWISDKAINNFEKADKLINLVKPEVGLQTGENKKFVKYWWEVDRTDMKTGISSNEESIESGAKWFPYNKGGNFRKWYGMNEYVVDWYNGGQNIIADKLDKLERGLCLPANSKVRNVEYFFKSGITWSSFGFENFGVRHKDEGFIFDVSGSSIFIDSKNENIECDESLEMYLLAFLASKVAFFYLSILAPTVNFQVGNIKNLPVYIGKDIKSEVVSLAKECVDISRDEWNDYEESWDFKRHPLASYGFDSVEESFNKWEKVSCERYCKLKKNEERMNELFINLYDLGEDVDKLVIDRDISIRKADLRKDIISLISYAVGCMFGRYSLDEEGLVYAGGKFDIGKYKKFIPCEDNAICLDNEIDAATSGENKNVNTNIMEYFQRFLQVVYGRDKLDENMDFIASALGSSGSSYEIISNYMNKHFYKDHFKKYKKKPIYIEIDSVNKCKMLIYTHRFKDNEIYDFKK